MSSPTCGAGNAGKCGLLDVDAIIAAGYRSRSGWSRGRVCPRGPRATRTVPVLCEYVGELSVAGPLRRNPRWHRVFEHCDEAPSASRATCCRHAGGEQRHTHPVSGEAVGVTPFTKAGWAAGRQGGRRASIRAILQPATPEVLCVNRRGEPCLRRARRLPFTRSTWLPFRGAGRDRRRGRLRAETAGPSG